MDDLAKRLRLIASILRPGKELRFSECAVLDNAADAIEALQAQVARLTAERDAAYERAAEVADEFGDLIVYKKIAAAIRAMKEK